MLKITAIRYANTPKVPDTVCIHVYPFDRSSFVVQSATNERVGLKLTLILKSNVNATATAMANNPSVALSPINIFCTISRLGNAKSINPVSIPPMIIQGRRLPPINHSLSLIAPTIGWAIIPAIGPAAHTIPIS